MFKRKLTTLAKVSAHVAAGCALAVWLAWFVGQCCNDRWHATQYLYWMPTPLAMPAVLCGAILATGFAVLAGWLGGAARPAKRVRLVVWVLLASGTCWMLVQWNVWRFVPWGRRASSEPSVRVLGWNSGGDFMKDFAERAVAKRPQVMAITNSPPYTDWGLLQEQVGGARSMARFAHLSLVSKYRILRWGGTKLGVTGAVRRTFTWQGGGEIYQDKGEAMFVEVDARADFGHDLVIWMIDIPSDPRLCKRVVFEQAAATVAAFAGPVYVRSALNLDVEEPPDLGVRGFPKPDIVMGDFNTVRGSRSMRQLVEMGGTMDHAFTRAGRGWSGTWPRKWPVLAIDQTFVSERIFVEGYEVVDMGAALHNAQFVDIRAKELNR